MKLTALLLLVGLTGLAVHSSGTVRSEGRALRDTLQKPAENVRSLRSAEALLPECDLHQDPVMGLDESVEGSDSFTLSPTQHPNENSSVEMTAP